MVSQALLPLLHWRGVPLLREQRLELTVLERFVLEMGLALGSIEPGDFTEVTSLPPSVLAGATWRLISSGTLSPRGGSYGVDPPKATATLQQEVVRRLVRSKASFALLPRTGDLLAVGGQDGGWLRELEQKLSPDRLAPLPKPLWTATRAAYLSERIRGGTVAGLESDVVDVPVPADGDVLLVTSAKQADQPEVPVCPVYLCRAEVQHTDDGDQVVRAFAFGKSRYGGSAGPAEVTEIEIDLAGAHGLAAEWLKLADTLDDPQTLYAAWHELGGGPSPPDGARRQGLGTWDLLVNGEATQLLCAQGHALNEPRGLAIEAEEAIIHLTCFFFPSDGIASALFARDDVITRLLAVPRAAEEFPVACQEAASRYPGTDSLLTEKSVVERIWQLGHYHLIYMLREHKDFCYD
jgi:hypothetical protein